MNYFLGKRKNVRLLTFLSFLIGMIYIIVEWIVTNQIRDSVFVGMLLFATIFLSFGISGLYKDLVSNGMDFYIFMYEGMELENVQMKNRKDMVRIFNNRKSLIFAIIYSVLFGLTIWFLNTSMDYILVKIVFVLFLMVANFVTGLGLYSLVNFFSVCYRWSKDIDFDIWIIDNKSTKFIRRLRNKVLLIMSIYISVSLSSILFSSIKIDSMVILYACFSVILVVIAYLLPEIPMKNKIILLRDEMIDDINIKISLEYKHALRDAQDNNSIIDLTKFNSLIEIKDKVISVSSSKLNFSKIISFITLILITVFPIVLQAFLENLFK